MDAIGMITQIRIRAAAQALGSSILFMFFAIAPALPILASTDREAAMSWAIEHREEAFDRLMPRIAEFGSNRPEIALSVRAGGFEDHFEFLLTIEQREGHAPEATLVIPHEEPLTIQLARLRADKSLALDDILPRIRLDRRRLPPTAARLLFNRLISLQVPLRPQTGFFLHRQHLEVTAIGWNELRFDCFDDGDKSSSIGRLFSAVWSALHSVRLDRSALAFDPAAYHTTDH
jgi:hypothetical protein